MDNNNTVDTKSFKGMNNVSRPEELELDEFTQAENVYVTDRNALSKRSGVTQLLASSTLHSLGGSDDVALIVNQEELSIVNDDNSLSAIRSGLDRHRRVSYCPIGLAIYYSNGIQSGKVINGESRSWAVDSPLAPSLTLTEGSLSAGSYLVTLTATDQYGEESGAMGGSRIDLASAAGIEVAIPTPPTDGSINIYVTTANGREYYWVGSASAAGTFVIGNQVSQAKPLETLLCDPMPSGRIVKYFNGRLLVASENGLWFSEPFHYGLTKIAYNFIQYRSDITMVEPVEGGVYVSADKTYFLAGRDITKAEQVEISPAPAIFGTSLQIDAAKYDKGSEGNIVLWSSEDGIYAGDEGGKVTNVTENTVSFPFGEEGAAQFFQADGAAQYVSVLRKPSDETDHFGVADKVSVEVYRNGVLIEG